LLGVVYFLFHFFFNPHLKTLQTFPTNSNVCGVKSIDEVNRFFRAFFVMLKFILTMLPTPYFKNTHISIFIRTRGLANNESTNQ